MELFKGDWGQVTYVEIAPGQVRGKHLHPQTNEVFCFVTGQGWLRVDYPQYGMRVDHQVGKNPFEVFDIPAGCGHEVEATGTGSLVLIYWSDRPYDAARPDVEPWQW